MTLVVLGKKINASKLLPGDVHPSGQKELKHGVMFLSAKNRLAHMYTYRLF